MKRNIIHGVSFADDQTGYVVVGDGKEDVRRDLDECIRNAQLSAQMPYNLTKCNGGLIALYKKTNTQ